MSSTPGEGFLLVASPDLLDPNFHRSVVLILSHDDQGSFGLVLNRPTDRRLGDVLPDVDPRGADVPLLQGGPVQREVVQFVGRDPGPGRRILEGVTVAGLEDLLDASDAGSGIHAYAGYAGWGEGQLEREVSEGSWVLGRGDSRYVFDVPADRLWPEVLRDLGGHYGWMAIQDGDPGAN